MMALMTMVDDQVSGTEVDAIVRHYHLVTGEEMTAQDVHAEFERARGDARSFEQLLSGFAPGMIEAEKMAVVRGAYLVALADDAFGIEEQTFLAGVGRALGLSPALVERAISTARTGEEP